MKRLEAKVQDLIKKNGVSLQPDDADDISCIVSDAVQLAENSFPPDFPQRMFWELQLKYR